ALHQRLERRAQCRIERDERVFASGAGEVELHLCSIASRAYVRGAVDGLDAALVRVVEQHGGVEVGVLDAAACGEGEAQVTSQGVVGEEVGLHQRGEIEL